MDTISSEQKYYAQTFKNIHLKQGEIVNSRFTDCTFIKCSLESGVFNNCRFANCTFLESNLNLVQIPGSSFPSTRFEKSKLMGINWTQGDWSLFGLGNLIGFYDCVLSHSTFIGLDLKGLEIMNCIAHEVDFRDAILSKVDFSGTDLAGSVFGNTNLSGADLSRARNYDINPERNILKKAQFSLPEVMALLYSMDIVLKDQDKLV